MSFCHSVYKHKKHDKTCSFCHYMSFCHSVYKHKKYGSTCLFWHSMSFCHSVYKHYISIQYVCFVRLCNLHEIRRLQVALKKGLIKHQEGRVLGRWRACSQMEKGMFLKRVGQWGEASVAVRFCDIGWLNVSVGLCVFCSSVFSVRKRTFLRLAGEFYLSQNSQNSQIFLRTILSSQGGCTSPFDADF